MGKALKSIVVVNLLLSAAVIWFGFVSFSSRQVLKAEALELEQTVAELSQNLQWGAEVAWEEPDQRRSSAYMFSQPATAQGLPALENELNTLSRFASQRQSQLSQRNTELNQTQSTLADTQDTLSTRIRELTAAKNQAQNLSNELERTNRELAQAMNEVKKLQETKTSQTNNITSKTDSLTELNNELASLEIDLETRIQQRDNIQADYDRCRIGAAGQEQQKGRVRGKKGLVLAVNEDWQYAVIDKGDTEIMPEYEALVHRGKEFVGKLQIVRVEDELAIAQIVPGSVTTGQSIKPGDTLFF